MVDLCPVPDQILILVCVLSSGIMLFLLSYIKLEKYLSDLEVLEKNGDDNFSTVVQKIKLAILRK